MGLAEDMIYECSWCGHPLETDQLPSGFCSDTCAEKHYYGDYPEGDTMCNATKLEDGRWVKAEPILRYSKWRVFKDDLHCFWLDIVDIFKGKKED